MTARFEFESRLYDPSSITTLYGSEAMLRKMLDTSNFDETHFLPLPALKAAYQILQWGDLSRLKILFLEGKFGEQLRNLDYFRLIIRQWSDFGMRHDNWHVAFELVDLVVEPLTRDQWGHQLLCIAARAGCMPVIQLLLSRAQRKADLRAELLRGSQAIGEAILGNHTDVVEYLLAQEGFEAHIRQVNTRGENVLHLASNFCNPAMFRLLVPHLQDILHQTDNRGDTALMRIIKNDFDSEARYDSASILLLSWADAVWDARPSDEQHDPLQVAVSLGDADMCRLLVSVGKMDPRSALTLDNDGQLVLKDQSEKKDGTILQLLRSYALRD